jgi:hypothetical protein
VVSGGFASSTKASIVTSKLVIDDAAVRALGIREGFALPARPQRANDSQMSVPFMLTTPPSSQHPQAKPPSIKCLQGSLDGLFFYHEKPL